MKEHVSRKAALAACLFLLILGRAGNAQELKDIDGNVYRTVAVGPQTWMAVNLNVAHFRNGDAIPEARTPEEWAAAAKEGTPAWCYYEFDAAKGEKYGKLYNWYAIKDNRGLAPDGWHIAANEDWRALVKNLMGIDYAGERLKSKEDWKINKGSDRVGFSAIPAGYCETDGKFRDFGVTGRWWSNSVPVSVKPSDKIYSFWLNDKYVEVRYLESDKGMGLSVRCEKD